ncbi:MAG: HEAT repeat domain-containing protein [Synechococcaceae cyanobacterium]|nr:HEAT repeat domain-containing protein [Synechococcaceae cyanobacterium]
MTPPPVISGSSSAPPSTATALQQAVESVEQAGSALALLEASRALASVLATAAGPGTSPQGAAVPAASEAEVAALEAAISCLVEVLGFNNPGAAVAAVEGLIALGPAAVEPLLTRLDPRNYGARAWAVRALAGIGDVRGLELLEEALAQDVGPSVRRAAACGLGQLRLAALAAAERRQTRARALAALLAGCADGEWVVRYAVAVGLERLVLTMDPCLEERALALSALNGLGRADQEDTAVVRLRASLAERRLRERLQG